MSYTGVGQGNAKGLNPSSGIQEISSTPAPTAPDFPNSTLLTQFWRDITGKEVQSAATYSYTWTADQVGHMGIGLALSLLLGSAAKYALSTDWSPFLVLALGAILVSLWELYAYLSAAKAATGCFTLDTALLRKNAIIAAAYMVMGLVIGFGFRQPAPWWALILLAVLSIAICCAVPWLRQKIVWQKAALPYLFRLAEVTRSTIGMDKAQALQALIDKGVPPDPDTSPRQVVIYGPIGSGRTSLATGLGTEFAFKHVKVRYLGFDALLEFARAKTSTQLPKMYQDGPKNIGYWPWDQAQVLIIDDIGPVIDSPDDGEADPDHFSQLLTKQLSHIAPELSNRHTVWIFGNLGTRSHATAPRKIDQIADLIAKFCQTGDPLVIQLHGKANVIDTRSSPGLLSRMLSWSRPRTPLKQMG
jgi:hypothetical protein